MDTNNEPKPTKTMNTSTTSTATIEGYFDGDTQTFGVVANGEFLSMHWSRKDAIAWILSRPDLRWDNAAALDVRVSLLAADAILGNPCHCIITALNAAVHTIERRKAEGKASPRAEQVRAELSELLLHHDSDCVRLAVERITDRR